MKRTALYSAHQRLGGKLIEFGGWEMPVQYSSIIEEHQAVRTAAGIFDISHMGEIAVSGRLAASFLNQLLTNDIRKLTPGLGQYTLMCNPQGGVIDDLYAYCLAEGDYLLIVNASRIETDFGWIQSQALSFGKPPELRIENRSDAMAAIAVQGPRVAAFIDRCFQGPAKGGITVTRPSELKKNQIARFTLDGREAWVARTGYTGEDGFEVVAQAGDIEAVWNRVLQAGAPHGIKPAGLGARDTLRTEVCYPLYGHELDQETTPFEAGLGFFVAMDKDDFVGKASLAEQKASGVPKKLVAFKMEAKSAPPRPQYPLWHGNTQVGTVASGTQSPTLGLGIGLGYVPPALASPGQKMEVEIRGRKYPATIVPKPFYRKPN